MNALLEALQSKSLIEKIILLLLTAALTGLLLPLVKGWMDSRRASMQMRLEAPYL